MSVRKMNNHMWTKENVKTLLSMWDSNSMLEIAQKMGLEQKQVQYMAHNLRAKGFPLTQKHKVGELQALLTDVALEMGIEIKK